MSNPKVKLSMKNYPQFEINSNSRTKVLADTYAEWDTWETINAVKGAIENFHDVILIEADHSCL